MSENREERIRVLLTLRKDYMDALDQLIAQGGASSRSDMVERIIGAFLADLKAKRQQEGALGALVGFFLLLVGAAAVASIFKDD
jgi:metal-responsive CopG/Arc/MetJ family transcriptional regulator